MKGTSFWGTSLPPILSPEEEKELLDLLPYDLKAKNTLVEHNLRLVVFIVKKFSNCLQSPEDLFSVGTIGLIKGVNSFNPNKNTKLSTYISKCIENEILMFLRWTKKHSQVCSFDNVLDTDSDGRELVLE